MQTDNELVTAAVATMPENKAKRPYVEPPESGINKLRRMVNNAGWTNESAFDDLTDIGDTVRLLEACQALDLETMADMLTQAERKYAAKHGHLSKGAIKRLYQAEYGKAWSSELTGTDRVLFDSL